jgi:GNAT superfamily N-acetyltransferase
LNERCTGLEIFTATADHAAAVHGLVSELAEATGLAGKFTSKVDDFLAHGFGESPMFEALVASLDGEVVAAALYFYTFSTWRGEPGVYLQDLVVTESARGQGVGERLMQRLAAVSMRRGATHLRLAVDRKNHGAAKFYERCGLSVTEADDIYEIVDERFARMGHEQ